jgi:general stress protein 26
MRRDLATLAMVVAGALVATVVLHAWRTQATRNRDELIGAARQIMTAARYCAVITVDEAGRPQARTIDAFEPDMAMVVWFATNPKSRKVAQIRRDPRVTLYYFDPGSQGYVTLFGRARLVDDPAEKRARWKPGWEAFYPDRQASYLLVAVTPERLEVMSPKLGIGGDPTTWTPPFVVFRDPLQSP